MIKSFLAIFIIIVIGIAFFACSDNPTSIGSNLLPNEDNVTFQVLDSNKDSLVQQSSFYKDSLNLAGSSVVLLGKTDYAESRLLAKYFPTLPDSLKSYYKANQIRVKEAWLKLKPLYRLGSKSSNFNFFVYQIRQNWGLGFNEDSLATFQHDNSNAASNLVITDTTLRINLGTNLIDEWIQYLDSTISTVNYGLYFVPTPDTKQILGFQGASPNPDTTEPTIYFVLEKPNEWLDTLYILPSQNKHVVLSNMPYSNDEIYLQAGYGLRGRLFFDLSKLKKGAVINKAVLELTMDESKSMLSTIFNDSVVAAVRYADSLKTKLTSDSLFPINLKRSGNIYSGDVTFFIQSWLNNGNNFGLRLTMGDELGSASRLVIYGSNYAETNKRPRLIITYSQKN
ncbi:DNRLRE domain-containing protein [Melioribacteraceae bacterium 4301-Me]|uniref:DNRLRE domain-containing protein n=1 Tax=Pyranulibacter aquaticus TaxID=3163344 RepID=UPI003594EE2D